MNPRFPRTINRFNYFDPCTRCKGSHPVAPECPFEVRVRNGEHIPTCPNCCWGQHELQACQLPRTTRRGVGQTLYKEFVFGSDGDYANSHLEKDPLMYGKVSPPPGLGFGDIPTDNWQQERSRRVFEPCRGRNAKQILAEQGKVILQKRTCTNEMIIQVSTCSISRSLEGTESKNEQKTIAIPSGSKGLTIIDKDLNF